MNGEINLEEKFIGDNILSQLEPEDISKLVRGKIMNKTNYYITIDNVVRDFLDLKITKNKDPISYNIKIHDQYGKLMQTIKIGLRNDHIDNNYSMISNTVI